VAGPLINTIMLTSVLGSKFQDDYMGKRPEYQALMARTRRLAVHHRVVIRPPGFPNRH
jgi:hypothetical protein